MYQEAEYDTLDYQLGSSPPCRPTLAEGSDLFKSIMDDFIRKDSKLTRAVVDSVIKKDNTSGMPDSSESAMYKGVCRRCLCGNGRCVCCQSSRHDPHRVQWIDEIYDKPLAMEKTITDISPNLRSHSPLSDVHRDYIKPILKHKANCIIIISE